MRSFFSTQPGVTPCQFRGLRDCEYTSSGYELWPEHRRFEDKRTILVYIIGI